MKENSNTLRSIVATQQCPRVIKHPSADAFYSNCHYLKAVVPNFQSGKNTQ